MEAGTRRRLEGLFVARRSPGKKTFKIFQAESETSTWQADWISNVADFRGEDFEF